MSIYKKLSKIQKELKAPKGQFNSFGKYSYRNCEDIVEAVKPLLGDASLVIRDEIVLIGDRYYIKAVASFCIDDSCVEGVGYAREPLDKKGMDASQITGAASSYARKYALNGLFAIDDTKDADSEKPAEKQTTKKAAPKKKKLTPEQELYTKIADQLKASDSIDTLAYVKAGFEKDIKTLPEKGQAALNKLHDDVAKVLVENKAAGA